MVLQSVIARIPPAAEKSAGDYLGADGLLYCGECRSPKQVKLPPFCGRTGDVVNCLCKCRYEKREQEEKARRHREKLDSLRREGLPDMGYREYTFFRDDRRNAAASDSCRKYVEQWEENERTGAGILFYGNVGTGKTFYACCIANALIEQEVPVLVISLPMAMRGLERRGLDMIEKIQRPRLLVLDDLGTERGTPYGAELAYQVIDARYRTGKPMLVTTNLKKAEVMSPEGTENVGSADKMRIYDRVLERCRFFKVNGESRRKERLL